MSAKSTVNSGVRGSQRRAASSGPEQLGVAQMLELYRGHKVSPTEVVRACLQRIESHDDGANAFCLVDAEGAESLARSAEQRWRSGTARALEGIPVAVKDLFLTKGWPTLRGSKTIDPKQAWEHDSPAVSRLREAGAIPIGKTTTPEFGWKGVTDNPLTGITRNPWDLSRTAGGSSGGSAAAVAMDTAPLALGTDGGGSIRIPAAFCGITGFKPTHGLVPLWPPPPYGTLAHAGPMARTAADAALMLDVIARPDHRDWSALPPPVGSFATAGSRASIHGLRIAYSAGLGRAHVDPQVEQAIARAAARFEELGARVDAADPGLTDHDEAFAVLWGAGAATAVSGVRDQEALDPGLLQTARVAEELSATDHVRADLVRAELGAQMGAFHETYDLLLTPTVPISPFEAGHEVPPGSTEARWPSWTPLSYPFNMTQQPAVSIPCGLTDEGLPIGLQLVGPRHADMLVLSIAHLYQQAHPFTAAPPQP